MHMPALARAERPLFPEVQVAMETRDDGVIVLRNQMMLPAVTMSLSDRLSHWARRAPQRLFLSEACRPMARRVVSYGQAEVDVNWIAGRLRALPVSPMRPLVLIAANGIDHALLVLAAMRMGIPVAVIAPAYAAASAQPWGKLQSAIERVGPGVILCDDPDQIRTALGTNHDQRIPIFNLGGCDWPESSDRSQGAATLADLDAPVKFLFTSGSTGSPKAVAITQRMLVSNVQGLELVWPFLSETPPVLVDWLPWNHVFGGNFCFNIALWFGGTLHIDPGRPTANAIRETIDLLRTVPPTAYFNVPAGFEALLPTLEQDRAFASSFLSRLDFILSAGAPMPPPLRARLDAVSRAVTGGTTPVLSAWGATETAPCATVVYFQTHHASNLGVPLPGIEIKLVPCDGRRELRVRGPNVMPGYLNDPDATAAAFDEEGFYRIGDAGRLADFGRPEAGILFDGRLAENFKLSSGTWVNVGEVRLAAIAAAGQLVADAVVAGEGRTELGLLIFANESACTEFLRDQLGDAAPAQNPCTHLLVWDEIAQGLHAHNQRRPGSSTRIAHFSILSDPPSFEEGEITEKGYLNQRAVLARRTRQVEELYHRKDG